MNDELARALCAARRRIYPEGTVDWRGNEVGHDSYFGFNQACPECTDLAAAVADELRPTPRLQ